MLSLQELRDPLRWEKLTVSRICRSDDINLAVDDVRAGRNIRGPITFEE